MPFMSRRWRRKRKNKFIYNKISSKTHTLKICIGIWIKFVNEWGKAEERHSNHRYWLTKVETEDKWSNSFITWSRKIKWNKRKLMFDCRFKFYKEIQKWISWFLLKGAPQNQHDKIIKWRKNILANVLSLKHFSGHT